ncbi:helix-turn-helix domain-containing protein [Dehalococcoides mccartyi]|jgi:SOS-response transcriptional repressors (RecA-mediated autopeptidases)|uniref:helix-turn-helix domain-containing protein n=1 Tax=Dehalococcoides mccartyi TaxID=61435 RepID=UPI0009901670|nr:XRE family transcriptional regulator [Dehalococcoides mccartyi]AQU06080.1 hypothetical protein B1777_05195 [Dehalococcoides mccartyi]AQU07524.1 hypothetical protein B1778_05000 [Dehalococcoides mccartyi]AQX74770.1 hypothetical protein B1776_04295 [Dehalococcoides mccartyi]AQY73347.1 hypothetical protein B1772_04605 [Dehalococcoides mccartyi]QBX64048.1 helix-turn-helix domain-containing protein [Dehalococcoides mccartyi]
MEIGDKIKELRVLKGLSQRQLAIKAELDPSYISIVESGKRSNITVDVAQRLARILGVSIEELTGESNISAPSKLSSVLNDLKEQINRLENSEQFEVLEVQIMGVIPAGILSVEEETDLGSVHVTRDMIGGKIDRVFALRVNGESLSGDDIHSGDAVVVDPDAPLVDGKIYAVRIENEVCARHVYKENGYIRLESSNGEFKRIEATGVEIMGRIVASVKQLRH